MTAARVETEDGNAAALNLDGGVAERRSLAEWIRLGITGFEIPDDLAPEPVGLVMLEEPDAPSYWLAFNNWYVLTRYNRSRLYASAVHALALAVKNAAGR